MHGLFYYHRVNRTRWAVAHRKDIFFQKKKSSSTMIFQSVNPSSSFLPNFF